MAIQRNSWHYRCFDAHRTFRDGDTYPGTITRCQYWATVTKGVFITFVALPLIALGALFWVAAGGFGLYQGMTQEPLVTSLVFAAFLAFMTYLFRGTQIRRWAANTRLGATWRQRVCSPVQFLD